MSDNLLLAGFMGGMVMGLILGAFLAKMINEEQAVKAGVAYYDPVTAGFKYQNFDKLLKLEKENEDE